ncbi:hypothetical protein KJ713_02960 [Patescibacteria group bacterium]|nr:hypothetical protein [Patescibacteria group bacterium]
MAEEKKTVKKEAPKRKETEVGEATHYFGHIGVAVVKATKGPIKKGDKLHFVGGSADFDQTVDSLQVEHKDVDQLAKGKEGGMKVSEKVHEGNKIFRIEG